jgi:ATP-dependent protease Clp ATPase subunit
MLDVMYEVPGRDDVAAIKLTGASVRGEAKPLLRRKSDKAAA